MRQIRSVSCAHAAQRAPPARCSWRYSVNTRKRRRGHRPHPPHVVSGVKVPERRHRILAVDVNAQVLGPTSKWRCGGLVGASLPPLIAAIQFFCFTFCHSLRQLRILDGGILIAVCHSWLSMDTAPKLSSGRRPDSSPAATAPGPRTLCTDFATPPSVPAPPPPPKPPRPPLSYPSRQRADAVPSFFRIAFSPVCAPPSRSSRTCSKLPRTRSLKS